MWTQRYHRSDPSFQSTHIERVYKLIGMNMIVFGTDQSSLYYVVSCVVDRFLESTPKWEYKTYALNNEKHTNVNVLVRQCYMYFELVIQDHGTNDRHLVKYIINDISKNMGINTKGELCNKLIVLHNIGLLTPESLQMLAVFVEKHVHCSRFLFTTNNYNKICNRLKSQTVFVRIPTPTDDELCDYIQHIIAKEPAGTNHTTNKKYILDIMHTHDNHMEQSVHAMQSLNKSSESGLIEDIVQLIKRAKGNVSVIKKLRVLVYVLLVNDISGSYIIKQVADRLLKDKKAQHTRIVHNAALYEHRSCLSERYVYHLEAFFVSIL
jgi:DNA polymerase III delta prime subunit